MYRSKLLLIVLLFLFIQQHASCVPIFFIQDEKQEAEKDTALINKLNFHAIEVHRQFPDSAKSIALQALQFATSQDYPFGMAEANYALGMTLLSQFIVNNTTENYFATAMKLFSKINDNDGLGKVHFGKAYLFSFRGNLKKSEGELKLALEKFTQTGNKLGLYNIYNSLAYIRRQYKSYDEAYNYQLKSIEIAEEIKDTTLLADANNNMGNLFKDRGMFNIAIGFYFESLRLSEVTQNKNGLGIAYGSIGNLYYFQKDYNDALKYQKMKIPISMASKSYWELSKTYNSIATTYTDMGQADSAIHYLNKSMDLDKQMNYASGLAGTYEKISRAYLLYQNSDSALFYIQQAIELGGKSDTDGNLAGYYSLLGEIYFTQGKLEQALKEAKNSHALAQSLSIPIVTRNASFLLSKVYSSMGNYKKSFEHLSEYIMLKDSLANADHLQNITRLEMEYEFDKKERQLIFDKEQEKVILKTKIKQQRAYFIGGISALMVIALFVLFFIRNKNLKVELKSLNLEQKLLRVQMNPHFIFNSLCSIQDYILNKNAEEANLFLSRFASLMRHTLEYSRKEYIALEDEIDVLKNYMEIQKLRFETEFDYKIEISSNIDIEKTAIPPMLTQPFIENSIEHALLPKGTDGKIDIIIGQSNGLISLEITDNGIGRSMKNKINENHKISLATTLTEERLRTLKRTSGQKTSLQIFDLKDNGAPSGTRVVLKIPYIVTFN